MGKDQALIPTNEGTYDYTWVDRGDPRACQTHYLINEGHVGDRSDGGIHDNLLITGESGDLLEVLTREPSLAEKYVGRVKCVYIDPPFNTAGTFTHYEDNLEHSVWLTMMRDRLELLRLLLSDDGTIWVHLDDSEVHRMRLLMDEALGADNFLNAVIWKRTSAKSSARQGLGTMYDTILVYGKSDDSRLNPILLPYSDEYVATKYTYQDNRGRYRLGDLTAPGIRSGDSGEEWQGHLPGSRKRHWAAPQVQELMDDSWENLATRQRLDRLLAAVQS